MLLFILLSSKERAGTKICLYDTDDQDSFRLLALSDKRYSDLVVATDELFCIAEDSLTVYKIIGLTRTTRSRSLSPLSPTRTQTLRQLHQSPTSYRTPREQGDIRAKRVSLSVPGDTALIKLLFHTCIQLSKNQSWLTTSDKYIISGGDGHLSKTISKLHIVSDEEYTISNIGMEKAYDKLFDATDEICCKISEEKKIVGSAVTSEGTYYLLESNKSLFLVSLDEKSCKCVLLEGEIISISNSSGHLIAFLRTEKGFEISRANETNGLISKSLHEYEILKPDEKIVAIKNV